MRITQLSFGKKINKKAAPLSRWWWLLWDWLLPMIRRPTTFQTCRRQWKCEGIS